MMERWMKTKIDEWVRNDGMKRNSNSMFECSIYRSTDVHFMHHNNIFSECCSSLSLLFIHLLDRPLSHLYLIGWCSCSLFNAVFMCIICVVIFLSSIYSGRCWCCCCCCCTVAHGTTKCEMSVLDDCNPTEENPTENHMFCACLILCWLHVFLLFHLTFVPHFGWSSHICSAMNGHKKISEIE